MTFKEWPLDVTNPVLAFVLIKGKSIILGCAMIQDRSSGLLDGFVFQIGQEHVDEWISQNPSWRDDYCTQL